MADLVSVFAQPIVTKIIETSWSSIEEELRGFHDVKKDIENLKTTLKTIQVVLDDAEEKQLNNQPVRLWLQKLQTAALDADDILDTFATKSFLRKRKQQVRRIYIPDPTDGVSNVRFKFSIAHKIKEILKKLDSIAEEKSKYNLTATTCQGGRFPKLPPPATLAWSSSFVADEDVFGRDSDRDKLKNLILSNESDREGDVCVIPIVGMGGLGKTTLAQYIFNDEDVKNKDKFDFRMWVSVTVEFNRIRILKDMIKFCTEMEYSDSISEPILESRFLEIVAGKKFFLVLDDVWTEDYGEWESLQKLLKQGDKGSRIWVTTRNIQVSNTVTKKSAYMLESLPEEECWSLFKKIALDGYELGGERKEFEDIGRQIVGNCKRLPLAVKAMAGLLRAQGRHYDIEKWRQILRHSIWSKSPEILQPILKLSYDHLSSHLKQCFAFCSMFPKAYVFDRKDLVKLWMAEGFIRPIEGDGLEETGIEFFDELLMRSFFQILKINDQVKYKMHDLIHDLALSVSSPLCCQVKDKKSFILSEESRHLSLLGQDVEHMQIIGKSQKLRTLLHPASSLISRKDVLDKLFDSLECIRALDLSSSSLSELPTSIGKMMLLRYLDLSRTDIKVLPDSICKLWNLQTLKLIGCLWLFELPEGFGNLINLRYLELDEMFWFKCRMVPPKMGNLTGLHNLHAFPVDGSSTGRGIGELKNMANLTGTLHISKLENAVNTADAKLEEKPSLQKLVLAWSESEKDYNQQDEDRATSNLEGLQPHSNLEELELHHFRGFNFPSWMTDGRLQKLVKLTLSHCSKCTTLSIGQFRCLQELNIKGMLELEEWSASEDICLSLSRLKISNCPKLRRVPDLMPNLRVMKIKKCDSLKALPMAPSLMFSILIDNLVLEDWKEGMCIKQDPQRNPVGEPWPSLIKLLELKMENCPNIRALPQIFAPQKLEISGCGLITALPTPQFAQRLQHLALDSCSNGTLVRAIPSTNSLYSLVISNISNLTSFPRLNHLLCISVIAKTSPLCAKKKGH